MFIGDAYTADKYDRFKEEIFGNKKQQFKQ